MSVTGAPRRRPRSMAAAIRIACVPALLAVLAGRARAVQAVEGLWTPIAVEDADSDDGSAFEVLEDGSVLVTGDQGARSHLTLEFEVELEGLTALRLEALPDPRLPGGGPGRADDGGFKLSDLRVTWAPSATSRRLTEAVIVDAEPLGEPMDGPPQHAVDGSPATAWGPEQGGRACAALFALDAPLPEGAGSHLRLTLAHEHRDRHGLGRVRVSVTRAPDPLAALGLDDDDPAALRTRVRAAIGRGVEYLLSQQHLDGSWRFEQGAYPTGTTALATYTLLRCGVAREHPSVERAIAYLLPRPPAKTYSTAVQLMALALHAPERHFEAIELRAERLLDWQTRGGWNYPGSWSDPRNSGHPPDLSITQYALLGLRAAEQAGVDVSKRVWREARDWTLDHQEDLYGDVPAGFFYAPGRDVTGSMTAAGLTALGLVAERTGDDSRPLREAIERGLAWLEREFTVSRNPRPAVGSALHAEDRWTLYYLYGLERVAGLFDLDAIGPHRWFELGATRLLETQDDDGSWTAPHYAQTAQELADTCFALLFLARATRGGLTGDPAAGRSRLREAVAEGGAPTARAIVGVPFRVWLDDLEPALRAAGGLPATTEPAVRAVRWERVGPDGRALEVLAEAEVGPDVDRRYPARFSFDLPGRHRVRPTVVLLDADGAETEFVGPALELEQHFATRPELLRYAEDGVRNLLREAEVEALEVSSEVGGEWTAGKLIDGRQVHGWCSADGDAAPRLRLELDGGVRADTLLLSPLQEPWADDPWRTGLPARCVLEINGSREIEFEVAPDRWTKTEVDLGRALKVRELELRVLSRQGVHPEHPALDGVGFAELELLRRD